MSDDDAAMDQAPVGPSDSELGAAVGLLREIADGQSEWEAPASAVAKTIVDALLHADSMTVEGLSGCLAELAAGSANVSSEAQGYLLGLRDVSAFALQRMPDPDEFALMKDSQARRMLEELAARDVVTSQELRELLSTGDSQISRVGKTLRAAGLVSQRRAGRVALWELTPRGRVVIDEDPAHSHRAGRVPSPPRDFLSPR